MNRICVIGSGISGLVTAKTFTEEGYKVTVFEKQKSIGGVWEETRTYPGLTIQNPRDTYAFSDYPMPASYPDCPTAEQMRNYLESYAQHFGLLNKIRFQTEVIKAERKPGSFPGWLVSIKFKDDCSGEVKQEKHEFDFVLVCNGVFNIPNEPVLPGKDEFLASGGKILHSTQFTNPSLLNSKRVIVVGFGKSALDIATFAVNFASESNLVFRQVSWKIPRFFFGLFNFKYILLTRFAEAWFPYRKMPRIEQLLHTVGKPLVWFFWRLNEMLLRLQFGLDTCAMLPDKPLNKSLNCGGLAIAPRNFYKYVHSGKIRAFKTAIARFVSDGVKLVNGDYIKADVIIFATGFCQDIPFLEEKYRHLAINEQGNFSLYRHLIHPEIPQMGFVGYNTSFYSQLTSEVGAWWLAEYVKGNLILPSSSQMYEEMRAEREWREKEISSDKASGTCVAAFTLHYLEQLIKDMGVKRQENFWQRIAEIVMPVDPAIYQKIRKELQARRTSSIKDIGQSQPLGVGNC